MFIRLIKIVWFVVKVLLVIGVIYGLYFILNNHFHIANPLREVMSKISSFFQWLFAFGKGSLIPQS